MLGKISCERNQNVMFGKIWKCVKMVCLVRYEKRCQNVTLGNISSEKVSKCC